MQSVFMVIALAFSLVSLVCNVIILIHAFQKSALNGVLCLCVPCYILYYMFVEFEHPQKPFVIAGSLLGGALGRGVLAIGGVDTGPNR